MTFPYIHTVYVPPDQGVDLPRKLPSGSSQSIPPSSPHSGKWPLFRPLSPSLPALELCVNEVRLPRVPLCQLLSLSTMSVSFILWWNAAMMHFLLLSSISLHGWSTTGLPGLQLMDIWAVSRTTLGVIRNNAAIKFLGCVFYGTPCTHFFGGLGMQVLMLGGE